MDEYTKKTKKEIAIIQDDSSSSDNKIEAFSQDEQKLAAQIETDFLNAKSVRQSDNDETGQSIEDNWEDDYKLYKGKGLQWCTNFAYRSRAAMANRPNSEDNFVFNTVEVQKANVTSNIPEVSFNGMEDGDKETAEKLTFMAKYNDEKNKFNETFKRWVHDFCTSGPTIGMVIWDDDWIGGRGPKRWIGDVRLLRVSKWEMYFDPAIEDLEQDLQDCSFIMRRVRKKLPWIRSKWDNGQFVGMQYHEDEDINEGDDPDQTYLIEYWHRGYPWYMPKDRIAELKETASEQTDEYKKQDYEDAAKGLLEGVHVAYYADNVLLEYRPYEYQDGEYPFVFTTKYFDEKCQWGFGEIRNLSIPQVMHNKADEMELEAMCKQGLGGFYYQKGSLSIGQKEQILKNSAKGGQVLEVDNIQGMREREPVKVPANIREYKANKERVINAIQPATTIQQGISPGSNVPLGTIKELGSRTDVRMKQVSDKLEDFLIRINQMRLERFTQFYTDERYYRVKGTDEKVQEGTFQSSEMTRKWTREEVTQPNEFTGEMETVKKQEEYIPEFDISVTIMSEKPTDRTYYTQLINTLYQMQLCSPEDLFYTIENGKMPPVKEILQHIYARQPIMEVMAKIQVLPPELQQQIMDHLKQAIQQASQNYQQMAQQGEAMDQQGQGQGQPQQQPQQPATV